MVEEIVTIFPEFKISRFYNEKSKNLGSVFVGDFAEFTLDILNKKDSVLFEKIIKFILKKYYEGDDVQRNLIWVGFFEAAASSPEFNSLFLPYLSDPLLSEYKKRFIEGIKP